MPWERRGRGKGGGGGGAGGKGGQIHEGGPRRGEASRVPFRAARTPVCRGPGASATAML